MEIRIDLYTSFPGNIIQHLFQQFLGSFIGGFPFNLKNNLFDKIVLDFPHRRVLGTIHTARENLFNSFPAMICGTIKDGGDLMPETIS